MKLRRLTSVWLPIAVAIVSVTATLVMWHALQNQERTQVERVVKLATYSIKADVVADMNIRIRGLIDMARLWQIWEKPRKDEFATRAALYISQVPGCIAVGWVKPSYALDWIVPVDGDVYVRQLIAVNDAGTRKALQSLLQTRGPLVMPTLQLSQDRVLPVWAPVFADDQFQGYVLGIFRVQTLLDDITADHADLGYEDVVSEGRDPIYTLSNAVPENQWAQEATIELPGTEWRLRIWPGAKALPETQPLSRVVLLGGLLMSIQLTLTVFLAQKARLWARHVDAANQGLTVENAERRRAEEALNRLSGRLLTLQDEERRRIALELHDSTAQTLYGLSIKLKLLSQLDPTDRNQAEVDALLESMEMADQCVREIRTMSYLLHPPSLDILGLGPAVQSLAKGFADRSGIVIDVEVPPDLLRLSRDIETALFRIVQEGLSNIHRHSGTKTAQIRVSRELGNIVLVISDQGRGCPAEILERTSAPGLGVGIAGMRVRVRQLSGHLDIHSSSSGTTVIATLPVQTEITLAEQAMPA